MNKNTRSFKITGTKIPVTKFEKLYNWFLPRTFKGTKEKSSLVLNIGNDIGEKLYKICAILGLLWLVGLI